jgi:hypothetical protein
VVLASLLPGLRTIRTPLAAGYVLLVAAWLAFAEVFPPQSVATGLPADLYSLYSAMGRGPVLAAATFAAYLVGVISVESTKLLGAGVGNLLWLSYSLLPEHYKNPLRRWGGGLFLLSPGGTSRRARRAALQTVIIRQLSRRFMEDEEFRAEIVSQLSKLQQWAEESGTRLPEPLGDVSASELAVDMLNRPHTRFRVLRRLIHVRLHAEDLLWESEFAGGSAAATPDVAEERDRSRAEADFRFGLALPIFVLTLVVAHRTSPWYMAGAFISVWLWYMGSVANAEGDGVVLRAVAEGKLTWPAAERLSSGPVHYRTFPEVIRRWPLRTPKLSSLP